jgi:hypothetical protein
MSAFTDRFAFLRAKSLSEPSGGFVAMVAGVDVDLTRGVYVGTGGDVVLKNEAGANITFKNVPNGAVLPIRTSQLVNTTGGDIVALY